MDTLTIRISAGCIIMANYDRLSSMQPDYEIYTNNPDISLNANLHQAVRSLAIAGKDYGYVEVLTDQPTVLVPLKEFDEDDIDEIYHFNYPDSQTHTKVYYDTLPYLNALLLFAVDKDVSSTVSDYYPVAKFHSIYTALIRQYVARYPYSSTQPRLYCYLCEQQLTLVVVEQAMLKFINTYTIHNPADCLYYIAGIAQRTGISVAPKDENTDMNIGRVYVSGYGPEARTLADELPKIGLRPFYMDDNEELSHHPIAKIEEFPYDFKVHLLRAYEQ